MDEFVTDDGVFFIQREAGDVAFGQFQIAGALRSGAVGGTGHGAQTLAQVFQAGADRQTAFGEGCLGAAVDDLQEQFAHGGVDSVTDEVGVQRFEDGLLRQDLCGHGGGVSHAGAADGFHQSFLNDTVFNIEGQFAGALLRSAPADTMGQTADILDFLRLNPFSFFRDRGRAMVRAFLDAAHILDFGCIDH